MGYCLLVHPQLTRQHGDYHDHILRMRQLYATKPVFNIEFLYEAGEIHTCAKRNRLLHTRDNLAGSG